MTRRFEMEEGGSRKFWEIQVEGSIVTVRFGRLGTDGQTKPKDLGSESGAQKEAAKLVAEKTKKGYVETTAGAPAPVATTAPVASAPPATTAAPASAPAAPAAPAVPVGPFFTKLYTDGAHHEVTWGCTEATARRRVDPGCPAVVAALVRGWAVQVRSRDEAETLLERVRSLPGEPPREPAAILAYPGWEIDETAPRTVVIGAILAARTSDGGLPGTWDRPYAAATGVSGAPPAVLEARRAWADAWIGDALAGVHPATAEQPSTWFVCAGAMGDAYLAVGTIGGKVAGLPFSRRVSDSSGKKHKEGIAGVLLAHAAWDETPCIRVDLSDAALAEPLAKVAAAVPKPLIVLGASYDSRS